jgi:hypothetical protein
MANEMMMPPQSGEESPAAEASETNGGKTALLPLSIFPDDVKPGDSITLRVVSVNGQEVIAEPAETETPEEQPMSADQEIDMMAAQNENGERS